MQRASSGEGTYSSRLALQHQVIQAIGHLFTETIPMPRPRTEWEEWEKGNVKEAQAAQEGAQGAGGLGETAGRGLGAAAPVDATASASGGGGHGGGDGDGSVGVPKRKARRRRPPPRCIWSTPMMQNEQLRGLDLVHQLGEDRVNRSRVGVSGGGGMARVL